MPALPFTADRRVRFLHLLATTGNVRRACHAVGVSPQAAYVHKRRDEAFAAGWSAALILARDAAEEVLAERALNGTEETIFYRGEAVGSRVRFDARLLLAHLARLDAHAGQALAEGQAAPGIAARFDEYLAELREGDASGHEPAFAPPEDDPEGPVQWMPAQQTRDDVCLAAREAALYAFPPRIEDLPAEALAELDLAATDPHDLWSEALGRAQRKAEAAAATAWDTETAIRHEALDTLFAQHEIPPRACLGEVASRSDDGGEAPPLQGEGDRPQGGGGEAPRLQGEGDRPQGGGGEAPPLQGEGDHPQGGGGVIPPLFPPEPPIETKAAKGPQDCVNRVNRRAGRPARQGHNQRMKSAAVSAPSAAWTRNVCDVPIPSIKSVTA